ncbi:hypothetical protein DAEQUDRAFT_721156 [Daedalea quercina L-15889]|uniref:Uncharacterized protein n=1 Tax=Daedalea quercina L-15889 TaxID=1314783 RepID=A0A165U1F9_9APHY|nr:hypothetical protein DAEQUDRAFT_721156 [Daedalea quercina L-15889]
MAEVDAPPDCHWQELLARLRALLPPLLSAQRASWEQGVAAHALLDCHQFWERMRPPVPPPFDFTQFVYAFAHESVVRQAPDGRLSVLLNGDGTTDPGAADPASMGEVLYWVVAKEKRIAMEKARSSGSGVRVASKPIAHPPGCDVGSALGKAVDKQFSYIIVDCPRGSNGLLSHRIDSKEVWSDTVYMLPPFLIAAAVSRLCCYSRYSMLPGDILRYGFRQIVLAAQVLQAPSGEWSHIYDIDAQRFKREARWGVGNGWVCCGIIRVLGMLVRPAEPNCALLEGLAGTAAGREGLAEVFADDVELVSLVRQCGSIFVSTLRACLTHMRPDGHFHDILDDPATFVETNLSQMLAYTIFRLALLRKHPSPLAVMPEVSDDEVSSWLQQAERMRATAVGKTDRYGFVRDVCGSPQFDKAGTAAEGQAWAIMMEIARAEWRQWEAASNDVDFVFV